MTKQLAVPAAPSRHLLPLHADLTRRRESGAPARRQARSAPAAALPCGDLVGFQVLLDRQGFSPGQIDGRSARISCTPSRRCRTRASFRQPVSPIAPRGRRLAGRAPEPTSRRTRDRRGRERAVRKADSAYDLAEQAKLRGARLPVADRAARRALSCLAGAAQPAESAASPMTRARRSRCRPSHRSIPTPSRRSDAAAQRHHPGVA